MRFVILILIAVLAFAPAAGIPAEMRSSSVIEEDRSNRDLQELDALLSGAGGSQVVVSGIQELYSASLQDIYRPPYAEFFATSNIFGQFLNQSGLAPFNLTETKATQQDASSKQVLGPVRPASKLFMTGSFA
ncbi:MAG: hypothetical protein JW986_06240 [Methanotrichaceae archaeon]|nr:hypothetical protein [Methanotrichaceae archaeon]